MLKTRLAESTSQVECATTCNVSINFMQHNTRSLAPLSFRPIQAADKAHMDIAKILAQRVPGAEPETTAVCN